MIALPIAGIKNIRLRRAAMIVVVAPLSFLMLLPSLLRHLPHALGSALVAFRDELFDQYDDSGTRLLRRAWSAMWAEDWKNT